MPRPCRVVVTAAAIACGGAALAQEPIQQSPITSGFWSWPRQPAVGPQAIAEACRSKIAIQFSDGHYMGVRLQDDDKKPARPFIIDEVGFCQFKRETQVERCELKAFGSNGLVTAGVIESRFSFGPDRTVKMTVTPQAIDGTSQSTLAPFDVYPVRCPDELVWNALNGVELPK